VGCRITNAVKCLPPDNRPLRSEVERCNPYLREEIAALPHRGAILALGRIAHDAVLLALGLPAARLPFAHGARHALPRGLALFDSYHCSRYNTSTGRLTPEMFRTVVAAVAQWSRTPR
jgi:uracil-DNA glycosylase family 4